VKAFCRMSMRHEPLERGAARRNENARVRNIVLGDRRNALPRCRMRIDVLAQRNGRGQERQAEMLRD
jgi:hypothetical protein